MHTHARNKLHALSLLLLLLLRLQEFVDMCISLMFSLASHNMTHCIHTTATTIHTLLQVGYNVGVHVFTALYAREFIRNVCVCACVCLYFGVDVLRG